MLARLALVTVVALAAGVCGGALASGGESSARACAGQPPRRRVAAARRRIRQLLPQLPLGEVHAVQPPDGPRPRPVDDRGQPDARHRQQDRQHDDRGDGYSRRQSLWFGAARLDLTVEIARARDWIYNYLLGFYRDDDERLEQHRVFRTSPCRAVGAVRVEQAGRSGVREDHEKATAAAIAAKGLSQVERSPALRYALLTVANDTPGTMNRVQYETFVAVRQLSRLHG